LLSKAITIIWLVYEKMGNALNKKGIMLYLVLSSLLVVIILANILLNVILSQARFTKHKLSRIQAYYASMAGVNYAFEKLRLGNDPQWSSTTAFTRTLCRSGCDINDPQLPGSIQRVDIQVGALSSGMDGTRRLRAMTIYTLSP